MTERDDTLEEIACYIDDSKDAAQRIGKLPLVAALEVMAQEVRSRKGKATRSESELTLLRRACDAAFAFIDSHVADPDLTDEMVRKHADYLEARRALEGRP